MGCLFRAAGLGVPRLLLLAMWAGGGWFQRAFDHWWWPLLGLAFLPYTLLSYLVAVNVFSLSWGLLQILFLLPGILADFSVFKTRRSRKSGGPK